MLKNNLKIAFRNLWRYRATNLLNVLGLVIGITSCLLIFSFIKYERSFDQFHHNSNRIYRVNYDITMGGKQTISPSVPVFVAPELAKRFPEIQSMTRFSKIWSAKTLRYKNVFFDEDQFAYADPSFFEVFDFKSLTGDLKTILDEPYTLVITKEMATKYFGETNPIGEVLVFDNKTEYEVAGIIENVPSNSHISFDFITSIYSIPGLAERQTKIEWNNPNYTTFVLLEPETNIKNLSGKIDMWVNPPQAKGVTSSQNALHLQLEPLSKVHFNTEVFNYKNELAITDEKYLRIFFTIAIMVLLIACANYINISTAKGHERSKEVAIRKTIGASFRQLLMQFLSESFIIVLFGVWLSIVAVFAFLPQLNDLLGSHIPFYLFKTDFLLIILAGIAILTILAGLYPAIVLARFRPFDSLKGKDFKSIGSTINVRKTLVVLQFTISVALIIGTIIVQSQLSFMQSEKLGLDKDHTLILHGNSDLREKLQAFSIELQNVYGVEETALTQRSPFETVVGNGFSIKSNPVANNDWHVVGGIAGDPNYITTLDIPLVAGRNFDPSKVQSDTILNEYLVNEAFLRHYALSPEEAVGKEVLLGITGKGNISGVIKDFHFASLHKKIAPVVIFNSPKFFNSVLVKVGSGDLPEILEDIGEVWKDFAPERPFSYSFLNEQYDAMYRTEQRLGNLVSIFCGLAIFITCLGLFGLMAFMVARREKEVGVRKVLGASVFSIARLLTKEFVVLIIIAIIISMPATAYFMRGWLQDFAYRIEIGWSVFLSTAILALLIAVITICYQAIKAALANPIKSLRME